MNLQTASAFSVDIGSQNLILLNLANSLLSLKIWSKSIHNLLTRHEHEQTHEW